jgi:hypothetical protein
MVRTVIWTFFILFGLSAFALAQEAAGAGDDVSAEKLAAAASGLLATGAWGGLWKGMVAGVGRSMMGLFSKQTGTKFDSTKMVSTLIAGAAAGLIMGLLEVPFDSAHGWLATVGATEVISKLVKGLWNRWAGDQVGNAVTRAVARAMPSDPAAMRDLQNPGAGE